LTPVIARFLETADVQMLVMLLFTYIAVASVVLNAMLMSVFERIHEFGIMKALGVSPWQCVILVYIETILQTLLACVLGLVFGLWVSRYFETHGINVGDGSFGGIALNPVWYAHVSLESLLNPIFFLIIIAILAVIYPAIKVAKIRAVDAIHYQ